MWTLTKSELVEILRADAPVPFFGRPSEMAQQIADAEDARVLATIAKTDVVGKASPPIPSSDTAQERPDGEED